MKMTKFDRYDHDTYPCFSTVQYPARSYHGDKLSCILDGEGYCLLNFYTMPYSYQCRKPYFEMLAILEAVDVNHISLAWLRENDFEVSSIYTSSLPRRSFIDGKLEVPT